MLRELKKTISNCKKLPLALGLEVAVLEPEARGILNLEETQPLQETPHTAGHILASSFLRLSNLPLSNLIVLPISQT